VFWASPVLWFPAVAVFGQRLGPPESRCERALVARFPLPASRIFGLGGPESFWRRVELQIQPRNPARAMLAGSKVLPRDYETGAPELVARAPNGPFVKGYGEQQHHSGAGRSFPTVLAGQL